MSIFVTWMLFLGTVLFLDSIGLAWLGVYLALGALTLMLGSGISVALNLGKSASSIPFGMRLSWILRLGASGLLYNFWVVLFWPLYLIAMLFGVFATRYLRGKDSAFAYKHELVGIALAGAIHENSLHMWNTILKADTPTLLENDFYYGKNRIYAGTGMKIR